MRGFEKGDDSGRSGCGLLEHLCNGGSTGGTGHSSVNFATDASQ
jgi:hypothetical protein